MDESISQEAIINIGNSNPNYSGIIVENISAIKLDLKFAKNNIENLDAKVVSKPVIESIRSTLQNIFDTVISTEKLFLAWNKESLNSSDRDHLNELESDFKKLVEEVQFVSTCVKKAAHHVTLTKSQSLRSSITATNTLTNTLAQSISSLSTVNMDFRDNSIDSDFLHDSRELFNCDYFHNEESPLLEDSIMSERSSGIRRINGQVSRINQMFSNLSSIIAHQGEDIDLVHNNVTIAKDDSSLTLQEIEWIKKIKRKRTRRFIIAFILIAIISFILIRFR